MYNDYFLPHCCRPCFTLFTVLKKKVILTQRWHSVHLLPGMVFIFTFIIKWSVVCSVLIVIYVKCIWIILTCAVAQTKMFCHFQWKYESLWKQRTIKNEKHQCKTCNLCCLVEVSTLFFFFCSMLSFLFITSSTILCGSPTDIQIPAFT